MKKYIIRKERQNIAYSLDGKNTKLDISKNSNDYHRIIINETEKNGDI